MTPPFAAIAPGTSGWVSLPYGVDAFVCNSSEPWQGAFAPIEGNLARPLAVVTAGIHGDEYEGPMAAIRLTQSLSPAHVRGTVVIVPIANPMAYHAGLRVTPEDGKNLARTFPGDPRGSLTERLAASLFSWISQASFLIDLHSGGVEYEFAPLAGFYGEPSALNPSFAAAQRFGLPLLWKLPETKGVLSCECYRRGITAIGCEYLGRGQLSRTGTEAYWRGVLSCLSFQGLYTSAPAFDAAGQVAHGDWLLASAGGLFEGYCSLGEPVAAGQPVGRITSERGDVLEEFVAEDGGTILAQRNKAFIRKGDWGILVAKHD
ncbi:MAG: succinylglutamate desuccinylase/aspartoacylase family protein [Bryobacteraceae bacterium]